MTFKLEDLTKQSPSATKNGLAFPEVPYGQPTRTLSSLREVYVRYGGNSGYGIVQSEM